MEPQVLTDALASIADANSKLDAIQPLSEAVSSLMVVANLLTDLKMFEQVNSVLEVSNSLLEIVNSRLNA
jgi:hypothetical protein